MERLDKEKNALTQQILAERRQQVLAKFMQNLKAKAEIRIHASSLEEG
jgi:hypothetical protein